MSLVWTQYKKKRTGTFVPLFARHGMLRSSSIMKYSNALTLSYSITCLDNRIRVVITVDKNLNIQLFHGSTACNVGRRNLDIHSCSCRSTHSKHEKIPMFQLHAFFYPFSNTSAIFLTEAEMFLWKRAWRSKGLSSWNELD